MARKDPSTESNSPAEPWRPQVNPWIIAVVVAMAAFMEVLDTSIANVALPYMAGNLGASNDESTWILTSYLVSNAIVLPISGWCAGVLGRKRFFMMCRSIFTLSSLVKVVQRLPVKIVFENGQDLEHLLRPGMSVVPSVRVR